MQDVNRRNSVRFMEELVQQLETNQPISFCHAEMLAKLRAICRELAEVNEFDFREIGDHLYDGIYIADGTGKTMYINKAYTRITGIFPEDVVGKYVEDLVAAGLYKNAVTPEVIRLKRQVNSMGESLRNGTKMLITGNPIFDETGRVKMVVVIDREITDLLEMKAELEASQEKMKAVEADKLKVKQEIEHLRRLHLNKNLIGSSEAINNVLELVHQVASSDVTVLIHGETGVGKEVVANEIHMSGGRSNGPFIKVNCAAIPSNLLEAELFGHEKGAFTGASSTGRIGMFELADKGTLLLDEIGDMPMDLQSKLLRVIQHKEVTRIGGKKPIKLDLRIVASTNCNLLELVKLGRFREDLYYRLNVFPIFIAPLRARVEDIETIAHHFLSIYNAKYGKNVGLQPLGIGLMQQYAWPGNVRELQNIIERLVIVSADSAQVGAAQLAPLLNIRPRTETANPEEGLKERVENLERKIIAQALAEYGSTRKAAHVLKIDQSTIVKKAKRLGLKIDE